ncbi:class I SAM-dependent methyltransferase [Paenibacillus sp. PsM32]|uniref:class I SAM-dependent methyltransferase n=1 Tax=unclassified Paenibacillus TaxID=185978 RepID=UPI002366B6C8|nr:MULTISPECIES: class I SAM-dependent methyltransferase [unclassified Paenibacillus]MDN4617589.1 class I SAM-dependent methyltransferase [Paenibacillus sp. PsM32]WDF50284.1 class I SAM-dependent methyltransferase [Paenibacillus sp. KACC 21273]
MHTSWKENNVSSQFNAYNDMLEDILGFRYLFAVLDSDPTIRTVLDYGCGPGKVAERIAKQHERYQVIAVDESENMLKIATAQRSHPQINYQLIHNNQLDFLESDSIDCAVNCFVIINNSSVDHIHHMLTEIYRVLKPGKPLLVLDSNPDATGYEFTTFRNGEKGKKYTDGDRKQQFLKIPESSDLILNDFYWSKRFYQEMLEKAGFDSIQIMEPCIDDISVSKLREYEEQYDHPKWGDEQYHAPFVIYKAIKSV